MVHTFDPREAAAGYFCEFGAGLIYKFSSRTVSQGYREKLEGVGEGGIMSSINKDSFASFNFFFFSLSVLAKTFSITSKESGRPSFFSDVRGNVTSFS